MSQSFGISTMKDYDDTGSESGAGNRRLHLGNEIDVTLCNNVVSTSKYNLVTFFPRSLLEQFRRVGNVYFLFISTLMILGTEFGYFDSPLSAYSTLTPLVFVLSVSMVKEAVEDFSRHKSDREVNNRRQKKLDVVTGEWVEESWSNIRVGHIVKIADKSEIPADVIVLSTSEAENMCYIETSNIDGETNLKIRYGAKLPGGPKGHFAGGNNLQDLRGSVTYELPNKSIHTFEGTARLSRGGVAGGPADDEQPLDTRMLLLRGSKLRNTRWVTGLVVYTGRETKVVMNSHEAPSKLSNIDRVVNNTVRLVFITQFILVCISTATQAIWSDANNKYLGYLCIDYDGSDYDGNCTSTNDYENWTYLFTFLILYNNFIPISLYVTLEMVNFTQAYFISSDVRMYCEEQDTPALARTSNMNGDLGQIQYVLSDKTGTLTCNVMRFKRAAVHGQVYGPPLAGVEVPTTVRRPSLHRSSLNGDGGWLPCEQLGDEAMEDAALRSAAARFMTIMGVCHTVVLEDDEDENGNAVRVYQAESPDEGALVGAAKDNGFEFEARTSDKITIAVGPTPMPGQADNRRRLTYDILGVNAFNSTRKRMSMVVKDPITGGVTLLCKGADNIMFERCVKGPPEGGHGQYEDNHAELLAHLTAFARDGLRTLVLAVRDLTPEQAEAWQAQYSAAQLSLTNREGLMDEAAEIIEKEMVVVGATAIEDRLQDGVPQTIADLAEAGIKLWVLTGDKRETAINIGYSCRLLTEDMHLIRVSGSDREKLRAQLTGLAEQFTQLTTDERVLSGIRGFMQSVSDRIRGDSSRSESTGGGGGGRGLNVNGRAGASINADGSASGAGGKTALLSGAGSESEADDEPLTLDDLETNHLALIVDGPTLTHVFGDPEMEVLLLRIARFCKAVVACRVSPAQKASVVRLVKHGISPRPITLAIGDGANDVSMIQEAQVGVGISGKEGRQAVNNSDFAIAQFRFLKPLLLVHGHWDYTRMCKVVLYSFYKNIVITLTLFFYTFVSGFSGQSLYESIVYSGFNFFLGMPIICIGVFDREVSYDYLMANPEMYVSGRENHNLNITKMLGWIGRAVMHAVIIYFLPYYAFAKHHTWAENGQTDGIFVLGTTVFTCMIVTMQSRVMFLGNTWTGWNAFFFWGSYLFFATFVYGYSTLPAYAPDFYNVVSETISRGCFWQLLVLVPVAALLPDVVYTLVRTQLWPTIIDIHRERDRGFGPDEDEMTEGEFGGNTLPPLREPSSRISAGLSRSSSMGSTASGGVLVPQQSIHRLVGRLSEAERSSLGFESSDQQSGFAYDNPVSKLGLGAGGR